MTTTRILLLLLATLVMACGGKKDGDGATGPEFKPGKMVEVKLEGPGVTLKAPDNLKVESKGSEATLSAPGFPTITVTKAENTSGSTGTSRSSGMSKVKVRLDTFATTWTCTSGPPESHKDLIVDICKSMTPPKNPRFVKNACDKAKGVDKAKVEAMLKAKQPELRKCLDMELKADPKLSTKSFSFSLTRNGGSMSSSHSLMLSDKAAKECARKFRRAVAETPPLNTGDLEVSCSVVFSVY